MSDASSRTPYRPSPSRSHAARREGLREWWRRYRWYLVAALWALALALGYAGFDQRFRSLSEPQAPLDLLYFSLQLFTFDSGGESTGGGWQLGAARSLARADAAQAGG